MADEPRILPFEPRAGKAPDPSQAVSPRVTPSQAVAPVPYDVGPLPVADRPDACIWMTRALFDVLVLALASHPDPATQQLGRYLQIRLPQPPPDPSSV